MGAVCPESHFGEFLGHTSQARSVYPVLFDLANQAAYRAIADRPKPRNISAIPSPLHQSTPFGGIRDGACAQGES